MFLISWSFTVVSLALASLIYKYVSIKGKAGDWGDGFKSAYFQLALRSLRSLGGIYLTNSIIYSPQVDDMIRKLVTLLILTSCIWMAKIDLVEPLACSPCSARQKIKQNKTQT